MDLPGHRPRGMRSGVESCSHAWSDTRPSSDAGAQIAVSSLSPGHSMRATPICREHVARLIAAVADWPPLLVQRSDLTVIDGLHRLAAALELGLPTVAVLFYDGPPEDAFVEAIRANVAHGLRLTLSERKNAAARLLATRPYWSDRRIGRTCSLAGGTVKHLRTRIDFAAPSVTTLIQRRLGSDGKLRPTKPAELRRAIGEALLKHPDASSRTIAASTRCSPATVRAVRASLGSPRTKSEPVTLGATSPNSGPNGARPLKLWQSDSACASELPPRQFAAWFDRTALESSECYLYLANVPLSRVYEVADEATRRARVWADFASALERRVTEQR
jgi:hypothetical protein